MRDRLFLVSVASLAILCGSVTAPPVSAQDAPAAPAVTLELVTTDAATTHLEVVAAPAENRPGNLQELVLARLVVGETWTRAKLRNVLSVQNQRLGEALETLERTGKIRRAPDGWQRVD